MSKTTSTDKRLLEALEFVDEKYLAEITDNYEIIDIPGEYRPDKKSLLKAYAVALARVACVFIFTAALVHWLPQMFVYISEVMTPAGTTDMISEEEYYANYHDPDWEYYGKYGNCYASLPDGGLKIPSSETVGGLKFEYETQNKIKVFYGGKYHSLKKAYNDGYLSTEDLSILFLYHTEIKYICSHMNINTVSEPVPLYEYQIYEFFYHFVATATYRFQGPEDFRGDWGLKCMYSKNGVLASYIIGPLGYSTESKIFEINDLEFRFPSNIMWVYHNSKIYLLDDAFKEGVISEEMAEEIYQAYIVDYNQQYG